MSTYSCCGWSVNLHCLCCCYKTSQTNHILFPPCSPEHPVSDWVFEAGAAGRRSQPLGLEERGSEQRRMKKCDLSQRRYNFKKETSSCFLAKMSDECLKGSSSPIWSALARLFATPTCVPFQRSNFLRWLWSFLFSCRNKYFVSSD